MSNNYSKIILSAFLIFLLVEISHAQISPTVGMFTQSQLSINPAYAGSGEGIRGSLLHRMQWSGLPGAPTSTFFNVDAPLFSGLGGGISVSRDNISSLTQYDVMANVSYRVNVGPESYIQAGLRLGTSIINNNLDNLFQFQDGDPVVVSAVKTGLIPRIGAGLYYKNPHYFVGISAPDLFSFDSKKIFYDAVTNSTTLHRNYYLTGGARINISEYITLVPNTIIRYYETKPLYANINAGLEFNQTFTVGAGYGYPNIIALYGMVGLTPKIRVGYRYEYSPNNNFRVGPYGTNEFMLSYGIN